MPRNGTGPSSLSITERRHGRCSVQRHVVSISRPRKRRRSVTSSPQRSGPRRCGRTSSRLRCQRGRFAGSERNAKTSSTGRAISTVCSNVAIDRMEVRRRASGNRYGAPQWRAIHVMLLGPPRVERDGSPVAFDTRKAMALLAVPGARRAPAPARRARRAAVARARRRARPRRAAAHALDAALGDRRRRRWRRTATASASSAARRSRSTSTASGRSPPPATSRRRSRSSAASCSRASACATRPAFEDWQRGEADALRRELAAVLARARRGDRRPRPRAPLARARPAPRARPPGADPALRAQRRPRRGARPVPRVRAHALARARRAAAGRDDAALRGDQRGHARGARPPRRRPAPAQPRRAPRRSSAATPTGARWSSCTAGSAPTGASPCSRARPGSARPGSPRS